MSKLLQLKELLPCHMSCNKQPGVSHDHVANSTRGTSDSASVAEAGAKVLHLMLPASRGSPWPRRLPAPDSLLLYLSTGDASSRANQPYFGTLNHYKKKV